MRRLVAAAVIALAAAGCADSQASSFRQPGCDDARRLAVIAQSVAAAAYVPCVGELPAGWSFVDLDVDDRGTSFALESDRADRDVEIELTDACDVGDATPTAPSDEGVRTYLLVDSIDPRYSGRVIDVFAGGCVLTRFDFERGAHVALVEDLEQAIDLRSRRQLRQDLDGELGVSLDP